MFNPILWAKEFLDWHCLDPEGEVWKRKTEEGTLGSLPKYDPVLAKQGKSIFHRPYQYEILACNATRKILKCVHPDTYITLHNGEAKKIKDIKIGDQVVSIDDKEFKYHISKVIDIFSTEDKDVYQLKTKKGHSVIVSNEHPFLVKKEVVDASKNKYIQDIKSEWLSIQDGLTKGDKIAIANFAIERDISWDYVKDISYFGKSKTYDISLDSIHSFIANSSIILHNCGRQIGKTNVLSVLMLFYIFTRENFHIEVIAPYQSQVDLIFKYINEFIKNNSSLMNSILRNVRAPQNVIELKNGSQIIGFSAGTKSKNDAGSSRGQCLIKGTLVEMFDGTRKPIENISYGDKIVSYNEKWLSIPANVTHVFPVEFKEVFEITTQAGRKIAASKDHVFYSIHGENKLEDLFVGDYIVIPKITTDGLLSQEICFDKIISIESIGIQETYDIEVAETKKFIANGIVVHNSCNMLVFDEMDMLSRQDVDAALAVIINHPQAIVCMSSTPTGKRDKFYESANNPQYKEFHFPSQVNPNWTQELEDYFKSELTKDGYDHEICFIGDTQIQTSNGLKNIKDIKKGDLLYSHQKEQINVTHDAYQTGFKDVYQYTTSAGSFICTPDHSFPNRNFEKQPISSLIEVPVYRNNEKYTKDKQEILARLVGYNLGDGSSCSTRYQSSFYSSKKIDMERLRKDLCILYPDYKAKVVYDVIENSKKDPNSRLVHVDGDRYTVNVGKNITLDFLQYGVVRGRKTEQEFAVPDFVLNGTNAIKSNFLAALFGAEGSTPRISDKKTFMPHTISLSMNKKKDISGHRFFNDLVQLCKSLGINCTYTYSVNQSGYQTYVLYIYNNLKNMISFFSSIGYVYAEEKEQLAFEWLHYLKYYSFTLEERQKKFEYARELRSKGYLFKDICKETGLSFSQVEKAIYKTQRRPSRFYKSGCDKFPEWISKHKLSNALFIDIFKSEFIGKDNVWNITVDSPDHSYLLGNGIRTFNCAVWGDQEEGVYQLKYIEAAQSNYEYRNMNVNPRWTYSIGVDWNDIKIGTTIAVIGFNPQENAFYVVDKHIIQKVDKTQMSACNKIVEINRLWNPFAIYIDSGFGGVQYELLHDFGQKSVSSKGPNSPDARLRNIVKQYDFGSNIEIKDPFTKQPVKKPAKPFLIDNSVRRFESLQMRYPKSDKSFTEQLQNYIIDRISITGRPVYKAQMQDVGDHFLDAVNLGLIAFTLERSIFGKALYSTDIAIVTKLGEKNYEDDHSLLTEAKKHQPKLERTANIGKEQSILKNANGSLPAHSIKKETKIWRYDGFFRDEPPPSRNTNKLSVFTQKHTNRPQRKKF